MSLLAKLILENDQIFEGFSFGAISETSGEVVFNTGMVGYPESITDPSYCGQILVFTYPLIGNYGLPPLRRELGLLKYFESQKIQPQAIVVSEYCEQFFHWQAKISLKSWLKKSGIPAIYGVDTRRLTKILRKKGVMLGKIQISNLKSQISDFYDPDQENLVEKVSIKKPVVYKKGKPRILAIDLGMKNSIIRSFLKRKVTLIRVPWNYNIFKFKFDGLFLSNGPGDPKKCRETMGYVKKAMKRNIPIFGICLGHQVLALAASANTYKLKYGHRSQNQPCYEAGTKRCYLTSQNHGYAVDGKTLPSSWRARFINANDETNEGIRHQRKPFFSCQFHPEANPGPNDTGWLFDEFLKIVTS